MCTRYACGNAEQIALYSVFQIKKLSGTKFRQMLRAGEEIPEWFAFKSVVEVLRAEWK